MLLSSSHLDNGYDNELYTWFFNELKTNGGKWDMIGMSLYPYWTMLEHKEYTADRTITECIANINSVARKYNCDVMVVETGMECMDDKGNLASASVLAEGKRQLARILKECKGEYRRTLQGRVLLGTRNGNEPISAGGHS